MEQLPLSLTGFSSPGSSDTQQESLQNLQGQTVGIEVSTTKTDGSTHLILKSQVEVVTRVPLKLPEGAEIIGQLDDQGNLKIFSGKELTDFTDRELLKLLPLKTPGGDESTEAQFKHSADEIRSQLRQQNYYLPQKSSLSAAEQQISSATEQESSAPHEQQTESTAQQESPPPTKRPATPSEQVPESPEESRKSESQRSQRHFANSTTKKFSDQGNSFEVELKEPPPEELKETNDQMFEATVIESREENKHIIEVGEEKIEVKGEIPVEEGDSFTAELTERGGQWYLEGEASPRSDLMEAAFEKLAAVIGEKNERPDFIEVARALEKQPEKPAEALLKQQGMENPDSNTVKQVRQALEVIKFALESQKQESPELPQLLKRLNLLSDTDPAEFFREISGSRDRPLKTIIRQLFSSPAAETEPEAEANQNELRSLLFLRFNDLPVNRENIALLEPAFRENLLDAEVNQQLPQISPLQAEPTPQHIKELVETMGFDMESRLPREPEAVAATLRGKINQQLAKSPESETPPRSAQMRSEIIKHALASAIDPNNTFIFLPYTDGEVTKFIQMMIRDERETGSPESEERWSLTLEVNLSALGLIQARLQRRKNYLTVNLKAENQATVRLLRSRSEELKQSLEELDYRTSIQTGQLQPKESNVVTQEMLNFSEESLKFDVLI